MKGIQLKLELLGATKEGITSVLITLKKERYELLFSSLNQENNKSYI